MPIVPSLLRAIQGGSTVLRGRVLPRRLETVTMELGRDDAAILVETHADGKLRFAFGSGEEFVGYSRELPLGVAAAARNLLDIAASLIGVLPVSEADGARRWGTVRMALRTTNAEYAEESRVSELEAGQARLAPLWSAHSELLRRMIVVLFKAPTDPDRVQHETAALRRARSLWGGPTGVES